MRRAAKETHFHLAQIRQAEIQSEVARRDLAKERTCVRVFGMSARVLLCTVCVACVQVYTHNKQKNNGENVEQRVSTMVNKVCTGIRRRYRGGSMPSEHPLKP
jgi:hypothetical protein